ncbi:glycosyltransferase family 39 protein [Anaerovorax odorimutans]|uniref:Glycosyltransferase family 39 protein n=1 Tax=Anaerovorax odorimutans TaxID=109327 RepID=A0ABT1RJC0_9FIRM|nr:O-antigen ligase family protein [Anaerovorax odorimutans]MCQ4635277.1 glycosyltransferase family 39 protein [Anaerovorax odorimutans]
MRGAFPVNKIAWKNDMILLQKLYIVVLNSIYKITNKIPNKIRHGIIYLTAAALMSIYLILDAYAYLGISMTRTNKTILGCFLLLIIIAMSINGNLHMVIWEKKITILWFGSGICMLVISLFHPIGEGLRATILAMLFGFPCLYFVWHNRNDYSTLYKLIARAFSHVFLIYFTLCFIFVPMGEQTLQNGRYLATTFNPNALGMFCGVAMFTALYLISEKDKWFGIYFFQIASAIGFAILSGARATMLVIILELIAFFIYYGRHMIRNSIEKKASILILIVLILTLLFSASYIPKHMMKDTVKAEEEVNEQQKPTVQSPVNRFNPEGKNLNEISSGRLTVWKAYLHSLNFIGHNGNKPLYYSGTKKMWAHNTVLEIAYRCGIIPGILFLILEIYSAIYMLSCLFRGEYVSWKLFSILGVGLFCIYSILEVVIFPFEHSPMFVFFIAIMPMFKKEQKKELRNYKEI